MEFLAELGFVFVYDVATAEDTYARVVDSDASTMAFASQFDCSPILCLFYQYIFMDLNVERGSLSTTYAL